EAQAWAKRNTPSATEMAFLEAGRAEREREEAAERDQQARELALARRAANRRRTLIGVLIVFLAAAAGLTAFAANGQRAAELAKATAISERAIARSGQLAAQAVNHLDDQLDLALLLSTEALRVANTV